MNDSHDLALMRAATQLAADPAAAAQVAGAILGEDPANEAAALMLAEASRRLGDGGRALGILEELVRTRPASALLRLELGRALAAAARPAEAVKALETAVDLDNTLASPWELLSAQYLAVGDLVKADHAYRAFRTRCRDPLDLGEAYAAFERGYLDAAQVAVQKRLHAGTNDVAAFTLLAAIAARRGDDFAEEGSLSEILRLAPCDSDARERLVRLFLQQGRLGDVQPLIDRLLAGSPRSVQVHLLQVELLRLRERHAEALAIIERLLAAEPDNAELWLFAGNLKRYLGDTRAAIEAYRQALDRRPGYGAAYLALANFKTLRVSDDDIAAMRAALERAPDADDDIDLSFALGKALEDRAEYAGSFEHYARANVRARGRFEYTPAAMHAYVQRFKATFTSEFFAARSGWGHVSDSPIFIVGLPRSGSTLIEQILASHPWVEGTRELPYVPNIARDLAGPPARAARFPEQLAELSRADVEALAARYLQEAQGHRALDKPRFIDKMHGNFQNLGLLHLMFPRARILDTRRHPMASGFAIYKQLFNPGMNFAYDLTELGLYYRSYVEILAHIDTVLPGRVLRVEYEQVVADTESSVRRLLDYCGLPFDEQCLRFHESGRTAQTISSEQVRRPIYADAVEQWRHYEPWLGPLAVALGDHQSDGAT